MRIATLFLAATFLSFGACNQAGPAPAKDVIAEALSQPNVLIVDVRSPSEWSKGHVEGALNVPVGELDRVLALAPDKAQQIVVHCAAGVRSAKAAKELADMGYQNILDAQTPDAVAKAMGEELIR